MKTANWFLSLIIGFLALTITVQASAQDWSQWRGANRDGKVSEFTSPANWPGELVLKWKVNVGTGDATPALIGDKLFLFTRQGDKETTLCLSVDDGKELWRDSYIAQEVTGPAARHPGPRSSPTVADGKIITMGVGGILSCLDATNGSLIWRTDPFPKIVPMFFTSMSPIVVDGNCIAHLGGKGNGAIIAYNLNTGEEIWRWNNEGPDYGSPVLIEVENIKQIVTLTEKSIVGINVSDGKLLWQRPFEPQQRAYNASTPIVSGQNIIYTGAGRGTIKVNIEKDNTGFNAVELWNNPDVSVQFNTPVKKDDLLFGYTNRGNLYCLDAGNGQTAWMDTIKHDRSGFAAIVDAGSVMMALPSSSELIVYKPVDEKYIELAKIKVADTPVYAHPVISGNRIFVKDHETIALWLIK